MDHESIQRPSTSRTTTHSLGYNSGLRFVGDNPAARRSHSDIPQGQPIESKHVGERRGRPGRPQFHSGSTAFANGADERKLINCYYLYLL